jgi:hypothetical protein
MLMENIYQVWTDLSYNDPSPVTERRRIRQSKQEMEKWNGPNVDLYNKTIFKRL